MKLASAIFLIGVFLFAVNTQGSFSQNIPYHINFDTAFTNTNVSASVYIRNPTNSLIYFNIKTFTPQFVFTTNNITVGPMDSILFPVFFTTNQNITYNDFIIFESEQLNYSIINYLRATAIYPDTLYRFTQGLIDEPLKTALKIFCMTNTNNNYTASRTAMFSTIDDYDMNDTIECVYTGRKVYTIGIPSVNPPQSMNTEHTFPQGFFNENEPMRSDIHHLFPSDEQANSRRSNLDFGYVVSNITWQNGGSKLGNDAGGNLVFESRDQHKGNIARCLFYFLVRYQNYGSFMDAAQENVLRQWNQTDTIDSHERQRQNGIAAFQHNRSPFVDHPEFIERIKSTYTIIPNIARPQISASPFNYKYDTLAVNDTASLLLSLFNYGAGNLTVTSITSSSPQFTIDNFPAAIPENDFRYAKIKFTPDQINHTFNSTLTIANNDSLITVSLTGYSNNLTGVTTLASEIPVEFSLNQNYPNPFNPNTAIHYSIPTTQYTMLKVYDVLGNDVATLVNEKQDAGIYTINWNAVNFPSGIYYYKIISEDFTATKKMTLIK
ncbi:MAG: endonuclease [Bacteroidota bacterium]|nr:endonuclease [Bacteroidota bacterium]